MAGVRLVVGTDAHRTLETGNILLVPDASVGLNAGDVELLRRVRLDSEHHKNVSYHPARDKVGGLDSASPVERQAVHDAIRRFSKSAIDLAARILPGYSRDWRVELASLRPLEEAGRGLPFIERNDLLHTDAFPRRPTRGGLILRIFYNFHASLPRTWLISDPFETFAVRYAEDVGLRRIARRGGFARGMLRRLRPGLGRSAYDEFMLQCHDYLKSSAEFQSNSPKYRLEFPPGCVWMVFTDIVPHAVQSGQFALEQTLIVRHTSLAQPERAPISILEKLAGCSLA